MSFDRDELKRKIKIGSSRYKITQHYECRGCGRKWERDFRAKPEVLLIWKNRTILVPREVSSCCKESRL